MTVAAFIVLGAVWGVGDISVERQGNAGSVRRAEVELVHHLELIAGAPVPASGKKRIVVGARPAGEPGSTAARSRLVATPKDLTRANSAASSAPPSSYILRISVG